MAYTVRKLATLAGISVRTLHHYDAIGLLRPARVEKNGYRSYGEDDLLRLQQILFFRELEFPLEEIGRILSRPGFDARAALLDQRKLLELKKRRLDGLMRTIDKTLRKIHDDEPMHDKELYDDFSKEAMDAYAKEAKERWGHTEAWRRSQERYGRMTKDDLERIKVDADRWMRTFAALMGRPAADPEVQAMIGQHYASLRTWYEPNLELYRGLADMYVDDPRFTAYHEKYAKGLARFMRDAMHAFCDAGGERKTV